MTSSHFGFEKTLGNNQCGVCKPNALYNNTRIANVEYWTAFLTSKKKKKGRNHSSSKLLPINPLLLLSSPRSGIHRSRHRGCAKPRIINKIRIYALSNNFSPFWSSKNNKAWRRRKSTHRESREQWEKMLLQLTGLVSSLFFCVCCVCVCVSGKRAKKKKKRAEIPSQYNLRSAERDWKHKTLEVTAPLKSTKAARRLSLLT